MAAIYHQLIIKSGIKKIFDAVTVPKELENWWPLICTGTVKKGAEYNFYFGEPYNWFAEISDINMNQSVEYKITKADEDWAPTTFAFYLTSDGNITVLNFEHRDWQQENNHFKIASFCWAILLYGLKNYLEKGIVIPFEERS
jgi:uncharacterized protein YndB with AHSA1/START domain